MDLHSAKDKILLKNCMVVKLKELHMAIGKLSISMEDENENKEMLALKDDISYYENLLLALKTDDAIFLENLFMDSTLKEKYRTFNKHILSTPAKELASEYVNLTKSLMEEYHAYSDENFEALKKAFYKGNENLNDDLKTKNSYELEEEFEPQNETSDYLTEDIQKTLDQLNRLFKQSNPKAMTELDFQNFSSQFRDLTKDLAIYKLRQSLDETGQTIDDIQISRDATNLVFKIDLILSDKTDKVLTERAYSSDFMKTYTQCLCYSYLEASKYASPGETCNIPEKMKTFSKCHKQLIEMSKCKLNIFANNTIGVSATTAKTPSKDIDSISAYVEPVDDSREAI